MSQIRTRTACTLIVGAAMLLAPHPIAFADDTPPAQPAASTTSANVSEMPGEVPNPLAPPGSGAAVDNPFRLKGQLRPEGDAYVDSNDPEGTAPTPEMRAADKLAFGYYIQELAHKALTALEAKDYVQAGKFYRTMVKVAPETSLPWARLCEVYQAEGKLQEAEDACREALPRPRLTVADSVRAIDVIMANRSGAIPAEDLALIDDLLAKAEQAGAKRSWAMAICRVGARLEDPARLRRCTEYLIAENPYDLTTISFEWALAAAERDTDRMQAIARRAERAGMPPAGLQRMREGGEALIWRDRRPYLLVAAGLALAAALVFAIYRLNRKKKQGELAHAR